jgi:DNA topoisomerase IA
LNALMANTKESTSEKRAGEDLAHPPVIVDLGQKTRKKINKMKKCEGPLYEAVCQTVEALQSDGVVGKEVQVVLVVVEKLPDGIMLPNLPWN